MKRILPTGSTLVGRAILLSLKYYLFLRLVTSLVVLAAAIWIPPQIQPPEPAIVQSYLAPLENQGVLMRYFVTPWYRWDTVHYLEIADYGYAYKAVNTIWPPLYSLLIHLVSPSLLAALIVSNLSAIIGWILLYLWVTDVWDEKTAKDTITWVAVFPTAFLWIAGYSESLFLALSVGCLYAFRKSRWLLAGALGAAAILTRWQGIILFIPLAWVWFQSMVIQKKMKFGHALLMLLPICLMGTAGLGYLLYIRLGLEFSLPWETISNWSQRFAWPWEGVIGTFSALINPSADVVASLTHFYDLLITGGAIALMVVQFKRIPVEYLLYAVAGILLTITKVDSLSQLTDATRYILGVFPIFAMLALTLKKCGKVAWFAFSVISLTVLTFLFYEWAWMA